MELPEEREARIKAEAGVRAERARAYAEKMGTPVVPVESFEYEIGRHPYPAKEKAAGGSRAAYMKAFRQRPVICPKCGHEFRELKRKAGEK